MLNFFSPIISLVTTALCIILLKPLALWFGLIDSPQARKQHLGHVPLIGGIGILAGFFMGLLSLSVSLMRYRSLITGCVLLVFVGLLDDFHELSPRLRLSVQIVAALLMTIWGGVTLTDVGHSGFIKYFSLGHWAIPCTIIAVVGMVNAINMLDGIDGLAGSIVFIQLTFLAVLAIQGGQMVAASVLNLILASLIAFLGFNFPWSNKRHAWVFMGDAGSMLLGFILIWFAIELSQGAVSVTSPVTMLWIIALPLLDMVSVVFYRWVTGQPILSPDRIHLHYLLQTAGLSPRQINGVLGSAAVILGSIGVSTEHAHISETIMLLSFLVLFIVYCCSISYLRYSLLRN